jgi:hypothetical protein
VIHQFHFRHFLDTWSAVRPPDVQKNEIATQIAQLHLLSALIFHGDIRSQLADFDLIGVCLSVNQVPGNLRNDAKEQNWFDTHIRIVTQDF